jgi:nucleoside-diphosphate-sugar epimerase
MTPTPAFPNPSPAVLVLGAHGRLGRAAVEAFLAAGWRVFAQVRRDAATVPAGAVAVPVDLADTAGLAAAVGGARAVVHAVNPVFTAWERDLMPTARQGMAIAEALAALFMFPGNVYGFGESMPAVLREDTPERPSHPKGRLRRDLEAEIGSRPGLRSVVIRAGDFFGSGRGSWFDQVVVRSVGRGRLVYGGPLDRPHAWAYVPDLARAFVAVAEHDDGLTPHRRLHFEGHTLTGAQLLDAVQAAAEDLGLRPAGGWRRGSVPWGLIRIAGRVVPMWRAIAEMSYLFRVPHALDGRALRQMVGPLPATPLTEALRASLQALGHGRAAAPPARLAT